MPGQQDFVDQMVRSLTLTEPDLDTGIGTTARHMIEAVADSAASASVDKYLLDYTFDADSKSGDDLENYVRSMGFTRLAAKRATGTVTFQRASTTSVDIQIPRGTQVGTPDNPSILAYTIVPAVLMTGQTTVEVPVQAVVAGTAGNVAANTLQRTAQPIGGISSFTNPIALTGGADAESDDQLRNRFKSTVFRNLAGTEQMFLGVALESDHVTQANVVGASKRRREQVQVVNGTARATVPDAKYIYPINITFGPNIDGGVVLTPNIHYSFDNTQNPPVVNIIDRVASPDGIYDLEYEYVPISSRNDPAVGVTNRVDVYVAGVDAIEATESRTFSISTVFDNTVGSPFNIANYQRLSGAVPTVGNYFIPLAFAPVLDPSISNQITVGPVTYDEGVDYYLVNDITSKGGAPQSYSGIEWISTGNGATKVVPTPGTAFVADYTYNAVPREVETTLREWRLVTDDTWVHQAKTLLLNVYLSIILEVGISAAAVLPNIESALNDLVGRVGFNGVLQTSDVIAAVHAVPGIDAVRFTNRDDDANFYAMQQVATDGVTVLRTYASTAGRATDVFSTDDTVIAINNVILAIKAQNTF